MATYKLKGDFAVITGSVTDTSATASINISKEISYPSGFTKNNCVVISIGAKFNAKTNYTYGTLADSELSDAYLNGGFGKSAILQDSNILLRLYFDFGSGAASTMTLDYKIILMKV